MIEDGGKTVKLGRLIREAEKEFAAKGYEKASTAQICQNAGVSKGLLFHYFGTKKNLYLRVLEDILLELLARIDKLTFDDCGTYLDNIIKTSNAKMEYITEKPEAYDILLEAQYSPHGELKEDVQRIMNKHFDRDKYFSEMVLGKYRFRQGVDSRKAFEITMAVVNLVEQKIISEVVSAEREGVAKSKRISKVADELFEYFDIVFYGIGEQSASGSIRREWRCFSENDDDCKECNKTV